MDTISKSKLKANMLQIFRELESSGKTLIVTDHNKPVLQIVPIRKGKSVVELFADLQGKVLFHEDPDTPTSDEWNEL